MINENGHPLGWFQHDFFEDLGRTAGISSYYRHTMTLLYVEQCGTYPTSTWLRVFYGFFYLKPALEHQDPLTHSTMRNQPMSRDILLDAHPFDMIFGISPIERQETKHLDRHGKPILVDALTGIIIPKRRDHHS